MKKHLPTADITNELAGASVFFQPKPSSAAPSVSTTATDAQVAEETSERAAPQPMQPVPVYPKSRGEARRKQPSAGATVLPRHHATTAAATHELQQSAVPTTITATTVECIRKAVKQLGKEAATHRFTPEEKRGLADLVYTYERRGYRSSENEITRIAINWLLFDYAERGEQSVLARALEALHR